MADSYKKPCRNSCALTALQKESKGYQASVGREFHNCGATTEKAFQAPTSWTSWASGTTRSASQQNVIKSGFFNVLNKWVVFFWGVRKNPFYSSKMWNLLWVCLYGSVPSLLLVNICPVLLCSITFFLCYLNSLLLEYY